MPDETPEIFWCSYCGKNIWTIASKSTPENLICDECLLEKKVYDNYKSVLDDHKRLVRELDSLINGPEGAAKQASLCDIVGQLKKAFRKDSHVFDAIRNTQTGKGRNRS